MQRAKIFGLLVAAGAGERLGGGEPKAFVSLAGQPLAAWSLAAFDAARRIERVVVAVPSGTDKRMCEIAESCCSQIEVDVVDGGSSRSHSVLAALESATDVEIVVVHDAARPLVTADLIDASVRELESIGCDGVVAAAPVNDTIKRVADDASVQETLDRGRLWAVQTPQAFRAEALRKAFRRSSEDEIANASDDAGLVERIGGDVRVLEAPHENMKVTDVVDLAFAEMLLTKTKGLSL